MGLLKQREEPITQDILVVVNPDKKTADIVPVTDVNHERVMAGEITEDGIDGYSVPLDHVKVYNGRKGRIFTYNAPNESIEDTKRLADLEQSTVLRQITRYKEPDEEKEPIDLMKIILVAILGLTMIILAWR